jgi:hypothetical protein
MPDLAVHVEKWVEDAKRIALGSYQQVLENGGEFSSDSEEGDGTDESKSLGNVSERSHQMSQEQVLAWHTSHNGSSQLCSETQAGPTGAVAESRASGFERSTTQARPGGKEYARDTSSPFPDSGTSAGSCEPTMRPPATASELLGSKNSERA